MDNIIKQLEKENAELKADIKELGSIIECKNGTIATLAKTRDNLKAENARLRTCLDTQSFDETKQYIEKVNIERKNYKLKQTLQEIKEIAERGFYNSQCNCGLRADIEQILQKITKAESEEE